MYENVRKFRVVNSSIVVNKLVMKTSLFAQLFLQQVLTLYIAMGIAGGQFGDVGL